MEAAAAAGMADGSILAMRMEGQNLLSDGGGSGEQSTKYSARPNPKPRCRVVRSQPRRRRAPTRPSLPRRSQFWSRHGAPPASPPPAPVTGTTRGWAARVRHASHVQKRRPLWRRLATAPEAVAALPVARSLPLGAPRRPEPPGAVPRRRQEPEAGHRRGRGRRRPWALGHMAFATPHQPPLPPPPCVHAGEPEAAVAEER